MRKGRDGEMKKEKKNELKKIKTFLVATNVVASRLPNCDQLQRRPLVPRICADARANLDVRASRAPLN